MKRNKITAVALAALLCGCSQSNTTETNISTEEITTASAETTAATTTTSAAEATTTASEATTKAEATSAAEEITTTKTAETTTTTTVVTTAETTTTVTTTTPQTTTAAPEATTTSAATAHETTPKTKKTKKTTTTAAETTALETTTPETTTVSETTTVAAALSGFSYAANGNLCIDGEEYKLTFSDEFSGTSLDLSKWEKCPEWKRQDLECYWDNNCVAVENGNLVLTAEDRDGKYYMGAVRTKGKFSQAYGYFEVRCTLNTTPGYWTAFWLMGETVANEDNSGIDGTEIDIMESAFFGKGVHHAFHWDGYGVNHRSIGQTTTNPALYDGNYHTFSLLWTEEEYIFYIDGEETWRTSNEEAGICEVPLYLKFTAETGTWTAGELTDESFPDSVYVDYIRVYSKG